MCLTADRHPPETATTSRGSPTCLRRTNASYSKRIPWSNGQHHAHVPDATLAPNMFWSIPPIGAISHHQNIFGWLQFGCMAHAVYQGAPRA
eukprot:5070651-Pleurochrysis_carterae.AAC.1